MKQSLLGAAVAAAVLALAGCGGASGSSPSSSAPAPSQASSASEAASPSDATSPSEAATPGTSPGAANIGDPCTVLDAGKVSKLTGVSVKKGTPTDVNGSKLCSWVPQNPSASDAAIFTAQEGPAQGGSLSDAEGPLKQQFGGTVSTIDVPGAEDARYITGKTSGANVIDVLALKDGVFYQVLAASPRSVSQHKDGVTQLVETLLKG